MLGTTRKKNSLVIEFKRPGKGTGSLEDEEQEEEYVIVTFAPSPILCSSVFVVVVVVVLFCFPQFSGFQ